MLFFFILSQVFLIGFLVLLFEARSAKWCSTVVLFFFHYGKTKVSFEKCLRFTLDQKHSFILYTLLAIHHSLGN